MKAKEGFITRKMGEQTIVVAIGKASKNFNGMVKLNSVGEYLWEKMQEDITEEKLVEALLEKYDVSNEQAKQDVAAFVQPLIKSGIVE